MANDRNRMMDDRSGEGAAKQREGGMGDDRMRGGGPGPREGGAPERTDRDRDSNRDDVRGIADEGDEEFEDAEEIDEEEEEEDREEGSF